MIRQLISPASALLLWVGAAGAIAAPSVVVTVKPVHSLVAGVMAGVGTPRLLMSGSASPHHYALRPSDVRALHDAALVFWVGANLETSLVKPLALLPEDVQVVALLANEEIASADSGERDHTHAQDGHAHGIDPHIWLDPDNARRIVDVAVRALSASDAGNAALYRANAERIRARIDMLDADLAQRLAPVRHVRYVTLHDAYSRFEQHYALAPAGSVTVDAQRQPGVLRVREMRERIAALDVKCVFGEPQLGSTIVATLVEDTAATAGTLDPLGVDIEPGPDAWFTLMRRLADSLAGCLARISHRGAR